MMLRARLQPSLASFCSRRVPLRTLWGHVGSRPQSRRFNYATALRSNFPRSTPVAYSIALAVPTAQPPTPKTRLVRHATPSDIETAAAEPTNSSIVRLLQSLISVLDEWVLEPLLTVRRLAHILILFLPVLVTAPVIFVGKHVTKEGERSGTLWWFNFLAAQMERAGPTFIKV